MKNFFKKLAFVLALAMVVTALAPAATASAAKAPVLNTTAKKLYLGGDKTGKYSEKFTLKVWNKDDYRVTFASDNTAVATVSKWYGVVEAKAVGTATITATVSNKETGKVVTTLAAKVYVKKNATSVAFGSLKAFDQPIVVGDKVKINVARKAGDVTVWKQADKTQISDYTVWTSSNTDVATVDKWGTVTAVAPGETTISAVAMQIEGKLATTKAVEVKVTVVGKGLLTATQKNLNTANLTFGKDMTADELKDVKVYQLVGATKVLQTIKEVKADSADAKKATVELYVNFAADQTYVVEYGDKTPEFVAVNPKAANVTAIEIATTQAVKEVPTKLNVKLFVGDVDVTADADLASRITVSSDSQDAYLDTTNKTITFFNSGKTAVVKATFHTYEYTEGNETVKETSSAIVSVDAAAVSVKETAKWYLSAKPDFDFEKDKVVTQMAAEDQRYLAVQLKLSDDTKPNNYDNAADFTYKSSDETVLIVNNNVLYGVKAGNATVIVSYKGNIVAALTVNVIAKRVETNVTVELSKNTLSKQADSVVATVKVTDQLGDSFGKTPVLSALYPTGAPVVEAEGKDGVYTFTLESKDVVGVANGTIQYKVTVGNIVKYFNIAVNEPTGSLSYKVVLSSNAVDTALVAGKDNDSKAVSIALESYGSNGYKSANVAWSADEAEAKTVATKDAPAFFYTLTKDNKDVDAKFNTLGKFDPIAVSGGAITKAATGTYVVTVSKVTTDGTKTTTSVIARQYITVTDTQATATVTKNSNTTSETTAEAAVRDTNWITVKYNGTEVDTSLLKDVDVIGGSTGTVYIKSATYAAPFTYAGQAGSLDLTVAIGLNVTLAAK